MSNTTKGKDSLQVISFVICTICHEMINKSCDIRASECGHAFHYSCLKRWHNTQQSSFCPICRQKSPKQLKLYLEFKEYNDSTKEQHYKEVKYLTKHIAKQMELLTNQPKYDNQMKFVFKQMHRSIMEKGTFEHLITDFINAMSEINLDDDDNILNSTTRRNIPVAHIDMSRVLLLTLVCLFVFHLIYVMFPFIFYTVFFLWAYQYFLSKEFHRAQM